MNNMNMNCVIKANEMFNFLPLINSSVTIEFIFLLLIIISNHIIKNYQYFMFFIYIVFFNIFINILHIIWILNNGVPSKNENFKNDFFSWSEFWYWTKLKAKYVFNKYNASKRKTSLFCFFMIFRANFSSQTQYNFFSL